MNSQKTTKMINHPGLLLVLFLLLSISCSTKSNIKTTDEAVVCGQIVSDSTFVKVELLSYLGEIAGDTQKYPDENGRFSFTVKLPLEFEFTIWYKSSYATLLMNPGDSIFVNIGSQDSVSFLFSGTNGKVLNELNEIEKQIAKIKKVDTNLIQRYKEFSPGEYLKYRIVLYNNNMSSLDDFLSKTDFSPKAEKLYKSKYQVNYGADLLHFLSMASIYQDFRATKEEISDVYIKTVDSLYIESIDNFYVQEYHNLVTLYLNYFNFEDRDTLICALKKRDKLLVNRIRMNHIIKRFSGYQKDYLLTKTLSDLIDNSYVTEEIYNEYIDEVSSKYFHSYLTNKYKEYRLILSSEFDSNRIHLFDLRESDTTSIFETIKKNHLGKKLYVDIWGTWCGSCISKFAYLPKLRESLHGENIEFIFLAFSSPKKQWQKVIQSHKLQGYHYLLNEAQKKELYDRIEISGIPHYFVIDSDGEIAIPDAKGPDKEELLTQLVAVE